MKSIKEEITLNIFDIYKLKKYKHSHTKEMSSVNKGVYFLFTYSLVHKEYKLIYIGQSKNLKSRLHRHYMSKGRKKGSPEEHSHSSYSYIKIEDNYLRKLYERAYIFYYAPRLNIE